MSKKESEEKGADGGVAMAVVVVVRADLHCEGCAHKVKRSIKKHFHGVETVKANHVSRKVTVVGKVDPAKVKERVEQKTKKPAQLLSPKPPNKVKLDIFNGAKTSDDNKPDQIKPPADSTKLANDLEQLKPIEAGKVADDLLVTTVVLKTRVHCDNCVHKINKIVNKYEGVEEVGVDLEHDKITVKGKMDMKAMLPYLNTKLKRAVKIAPPPAPTTTNVINKKPKENKTKKERGEGEGEYKTKKEQGEEKPKVVSSGGRDEDNVTKPAEEKPTTKIEEVVVNKMEYNGTNGYEYGAHTYDPQHDPAGKGYVTEYWNAPEYTDAPPYPFDLHAPEMFSDENPNGCSVM